jgi:hypothetical protein
MKGTTMRASIVRSFLIAVVTASLFGTVPAAAGDETPSGSTGAALDASGPIVPGATLWSKRYIRYGNDEARDLGVSPDGSKVFVTGYSGDDYDYATVAYDASTGAELWSKHYTSPAGGIPSALGVSPDGTAVFVTGYSVEPSYAATDYATVAYDASTGATLWSRLYNGPGNDSATALGVSPDGTAVFVTGYSDPSASGYHYDYATVAYDASTGAKLWVKRYTRPGDGLDIARALGVSHDGSEVFVTGYSDGSTSGDDYHYATVAYDASTGAKQWVKRYNGPGNDSEAFALAVSPDGSAVFVTGDSSGSTSGFDPDYVTVAYAPSTGAKLWVKRYNGPEDYIDYARALGVSPDGSEVFVTGSSQGPTGGGHYATVAYDASTGATLWERRYNRPGNYSEASALGVSPDGSEVFVTGYTFGPTTLPDYATVAYDASTGAKLWSTRYYGPDNGYDIPNALGVSPDGSKVFVTGYTDPSASGYRYDYATVAYSTG